MHGIVREKFFVFLGELRGKRFVVGDDKRRLLDLLDDIGDGKSFARSGNAKKRLFFQTFFNSFHKLFDGFRLVACGRVFGFDFEF